MKVSYFPPELSVRPVQVERNMCQTGSGNTIPGVGGESPDPWEDDSNN